MAEPEIPVLTGVYNNVMPNLAPAMPVGGGGGFDDSTTRTEKRRILLSEASRKLLIEQGFTTGLMEAMESNCKRAFTHSIWVVDNSGSMQNQDGQRIVMCTTNQKHHHHHPHDAYQILPSTRWAEMQQTVDYHAQLAALLEFPTTFRLLNDPGRIAGPQIFTVAHLDDLALAQTTMEQTQPAGVTPLTRHLREIRNSIQAMEGSLRSNGMKVNITLATDGIPTDERGNADDLCQQQFMAAMRDLEGLPIWIVVRLCTNDEAIVRFWNELDQNLELSLEVLDDFGAEAAEVHAHNPWLTYALPLHRMREMGFYSQVFDAIDERPLHKSEIKELMKIIFGRQRLMEIPDPEVDWKGFSTRIASYNEAETKQYDMIHKKLLPWIDMKKLNKIYGPSSFFFGLFG